MIPNHIRLIAFDLDDTLWPCKPTIIKAEETSYAWLKNHYPMITERYSMTSMMGLRKDFMLKHPHLQCDLTQMRRQFLAFLASQCHYPEADVADEGLKVFRHARNQVTLFDDVLITLQHLSRKFYLATISNGNAQIEETELAPFIHYHVIAEQVQSVKPEPIMFESIEKQAQLKPEQCLYIGDDMSADMMGAQNAGWERIWLNRENLQWDQSLGEEPTSISSLHQIPISSI